MRTVLPAKLESGRVRRGTWASSPQDGPNGVFVMQGPHGTELDIGADSGDGKTAVVVNGSRRQSHAPSGWEHVAVATKHRTPTWDEMAFVKNLFWKEEECVVEYHPPASEYIKHNPHRLHLWRPKHKTVPMPPKELALYGFDPRAEKR